MLTPEQIETRLERILLTVQKPGRYVGGELNAIVKDWSQIPVKIALVFPDIYDLGVSNLGLHILYDQVNQRPDALAERAYAPWIDMEEKMRLAQIPLYSLESKQPLTVFDIVGFSLPYESLYTNTLNLLDLSGIPIYSSDRTEEHPLVIAGGHSTFNPEPMHAFIDVFAIGEGEDIIHDIIDMYKVWKRKTSTRKDLLRLMLQIPGAYVPAFYKTHYLDDQTVSHIETLLPEAPRSVVKRIVGKLPPSPTRLIVPNIEVVHNRVSVEVMRGCTRGCRFCQAGMIVRPVRERPVNEIVESAEEAVKATGCEELALMSLSSSDYTHIVELVDAISKNFESQKLTISLPSLRIETVSVALMEHLRDRRSSGFTLAPEAATERMRRIINKYISDDQILETVRAIYTRGWTSIKLYFMIGHPSEELADVGAIASLCKAVLAEGRKIVGGRARVHAGISTFVPKPHTPFQWVACDTIDQIEAKQSLLRRDLRDKALKLSWTSFEDTMLEAWLARGDRRTSDVIYTAWKNGAKFDAWTDQRRYPLWLSAFAEHGLDPAFYTHRPRSLDEVFPWDHINTGVRKRYLYQDYCQSLENQIRVDCRAQCFACGILPVFADLRRAYPGDGWKCPEVRSPARKESIEQMLVTNRD